MATVPRMPPLPHAPRLPRLAQPVPEDTPAEYQGRHRAQGLNARIIAQTRDRCTEAVLATGGTQDDVHKPRHAGGVGCAPQGCPGADIRAWAGDA